MTEDVRDASKSSNGYHYQRLYLLHDILNAYISGEINAEFKEEEFEDYFIMKNAIQIKYHHTSASETLVFNDSCGILKVILNHYNKINIDKIEKIVYRVGFNDFDGKAFKSRLLIFKKINEYSKKKNDQQLITKYFIDLFEKKTKTCYDNAKHDDKTINEIINKLSALNIEQVADDIVQLSEKVNDDVYDNLVNNDLNATEKINDKTNTDVIEHDINENKETKENKLSVDTKTEKFRNKLYACIKFAKNNLTQFGKFLNKFELEKGLSYSELRDGICKFISEIKAFDNFRDMLVQNYPGISSKDKDNADNETNKIIMSSLYDMLTNRSFEFKPDIKEKFEKVGDIVKNFENQVELIIKNGKYALLLYLTHLDKSDGLYINKIVDTYNYTKSLSIGEILKQLKNPKIHNQLIHKICDRVNYDFCGDEKLLYHMARCADPDKPSYNITDYVNFEKIDEARDKVISSNTKTKGNKKKQMIVKGKSDNKKRKK